MRSFPMIAALGAGLLASTAAWADGAIAVGGGSFGFSRNEANMHVAQRSALGRCGNDQCRIVLTFSGSCAAYAASPNGTSGWASRSDEAAARERAVENCVNSGGQNCRVQTNLGYECDGR